MKIKMDLFSKGPVVVGIIGQGYVGLPLALLFAESKLRVIGFDVNRSKVDALNKGKSFIEYIPAERIQRARAAEFYEATTDMRCLGKPDAVIICVPTPLDRYLQPDVHFITRSAQAIAQCLRPGQLIVLGSTSYPGCTRQDVLPALEATGLKLDRDFAVAFSPEREDPSNKSFSTHNIPKLVGGLTELGGDLAYSLYSRAIKTVIKVTSAEVAESAKLLENIFRCVNVALVNELKMVFQKMGIDIWEVIRAASTKPFGFMPFYPGPGLGGHCIPIDPFYLTWKAREYGLHTRFIELAGEVNTAMPEWVASQVGEALNNRQKSLHGANVLILGLAYKKNVDDMRESPSLKIMEILQKKGAKIAYSDPHVPIFPKLSALRLKMKNISLTPKSIASFDCVIVVTNHDKFDYELIKKYAPLIVDTRGVYHRPAGNIVSA